MMLVIGTWDSIGRFPISTDFSDNRNILDFPQPKNNNTLENECIYCLVYPANLTPVKSLNPPLWSSYQLVE